jgi:hypothetical protein
VCFKEQSEELLEELAYQMILEIIVETNQSEQRRQQNQYRKVDQSNKTKLKVVSIDISG